MIKLFAELHNELTSLKIIWGKSGKLPEKI